MGKHRYGVILDAGSSGTRVYIYKWLDAHAARESKKPEVLSSLPEIKMIKEKKVHPGISTFGETPEQVGDGLSELISYAIKHVPKDEIEKTPVFLLATAGMRLLPSVQRDAVLQSTCNYLKQNSNFQLPDCNLHVQVIPGETEGLYGWIAANYLLGGFDAPEEHNHGKDHHTYGFLDMGGASAQIAFAPNATEAEKHANDLKMLRLRRINGESVEYRVFVTTWLGFGANEARRRYVEGLLESYPDVTELPDPCLPVGLIVTKSGDIINSDSTKTKEEMRLVGTGLFSECLKRTNPLLGKDEPCLDEPCLLNGVHTPAIDFDINHFVGVSEFWHTTHELFAMAHKDKAYDFATYQKQVTDLCSRDWPSLQKDITDHKWGKKGDAKTVEEVCFKASWLINVLHDGIGVPRYGIEDSGQPTTNKTADVIENAKNKGFLDPFQAVDKIRGEEVSWTLGKIVLYASSQIPPSAEGTALKVGFGKNEPGNPFPTDFEMPGGFRLDQAEVTDINEPDDWHERIASADLSRRIPGLLIFLAILVMAAYLLCGRGRRLVMQQKILTMLGRHPRGGLPRARRRKGAPSILSSALFSGNNETSYERVLEEADLDDTELASYPGSRLSSPGAGSLDALDHLADGSVRNATRAGRTSGWATPVTRSLSPDFTRSPPKTKGYFDITNPHVATTNASSVAAVTSAGLGITPFDRGGLIARTESKERLAIRDPRSRSRVGSPTRRSPLLTPLSKENID